MPQTASQTKPRCTSGWSPARRAAQSAAIRRWAPWKNSTGPRTAAGKAKAAQNAAKPHLRHSPDYMMRQALRAQGRYLTELNRYFALEKNPHKNELLKRILKNRRRTLYRKGYKVTVALLHALLYAKLCKNLDFWDPDPLKVNANDA